jgi:hypothetical protein
MGATAALAAALVVLVAGAVLAGDVYINGQAVRGITNLTLEGCTVVFNARGDVYVTAPGFKVLDTAATGDQASKALAPASNLKNRYFVFTDSDAVGKVPFDFELLVNGQSVKKFTSSDVPLGLELTLFLKPGRNTLELRSTFDPAKMGDATGTYTVRVGRGEPVQGSLEIREILLTYVRKGSEMNNSTDTFDLDVK